MWAIPTKKEKIINELNIVKGLNPGVIVVDSDWPFDNLGGSHLQSQSDAVFTFKRLLRFKLTEVKLTEPK